MKCKVVMSWYGHQIWYDGDYYSVALKRNGTDNYFETIYDAMEAIEKYENKKSCGITPV